MQMPSPTHTSLVTTSLSLLHPRYNSLKSIPHLPSRPRPCTSWLRTHVEPPDRIDMKKIQILTASASGCSGPCPTHYCYLSEFRPWLRSTLAILISLFSFRRIMMPRCNSRAGFAGHGGWKPDFVGDQHPLSLPCRAVGVVYWADDLLYSAISRECIGTIDL
jgi:hypothetical protein